jgi:sugar phosphate isomerase/epimerase
VAIRLRARLWLATLALLTAAFLPAAAWGGDKAIWPFFAFDNGVGRGRWSPAEQAATLAELGYDGISYNYTNNRDLAERIKAFGDAKLRIFAIYFPVRLPGGYDANLKEAIRMLAGSDTVLWMTVGGGRPGADDPQAGTLIRGGAGLAGESGLRIALYPHAGNYVATADDALRLVKKIDRKNVGVTLNLCHELMAGNGPRLGAMLRDSLPHLFLVAINGADAVPEGKRPTWKQLIQPLGQGDFDVLGHLRDLKRAGYRGPIGLQCYNVPGDHKENLHRSLAAWKKYTDALGSAQR